jgi:hypothetical protein
MFWAVEDHKWNGKRHLAKPGIIAGKTASSGAINLVLEDME